jgi:hypothetical protein
MFDGPAAFGEYLRGGDVVALGRLVRWDGANGGTVRVETSLRGRVEGDEVDFTPGGGIVAAGTGDRGVVVLKGIKAAFRLHSFCGAPGLYEHSDAFRKLVEDLPVGEEQRGLTHPSESGCHETVDMGAARGPRRGRRAQ